MKTLAVVLLFVLVGLIYARGNRNLKEEIEHEIAQEIMNDIEENNEIDINDQVEVNDPNPDPYLWWRRRRHRRRRITIPIEEYLKLKTKKV
uniref:Arminin-like peptide 27077 n=1 Tax=Hydra vulgaris TaxID=6087 RepID=R9UCY3_HYDVU|nr:arminin-like peptide 27077 [Hydra vulgaris]